MEHGGDVIQKLPPPDVQRIVISAPGVALNSTSSDRGRGADLRQTSRCSEASTESTSSRPTGCRRASRRT